MPYNFRLFYLNAPVSACPADECAIPREENIAICPKCRREVDTIEWLQFVATTEFIGVEADSSVHIDQHDELILKIRENSFALLFFNGGVAPPLVDFC